MEPEPSAPDRRVHPPRRRVDVDLQTAHERLGFAVDAAELGAFFCAMPAGPIECSDRCREHFWLPKNATLDVEILYAAIHPEDRERVRSAVKDALHRHQPCDIEFRTVSPAGEFRWIRSIGKSFAGADGESRHFDGITLDVTQSRQAGQALEEQTRTLERITRRLEFMDQLGDRTREIDNPGEFLRVSTTALGIHLGTSRCSYASVAEDGEAVTVLGNYVNARASLAGEFRLAAFGETIVSEAREGRTIVVADVESAIDSAAARAEYAALGIRAFISRPLIRNGRLAALLSVDQTEPRQWQEEEVRLVEEVAERSWSAIDRITAANELARSRERLLSTERNARLAAERAGRMKDEFLATLSHELRTPLSAIMGWAQVLSSKPDDAQLAAEGAAVILRNAGVQAQIIDDLLDMSRIVAGKVRLEIESVDLAGILAESIDTVRTAANAKGIRITLTAPESLPLIAGDPQRLRQVFWNLLSNAVKFTPREGCIDATIFLEPAQVAVTVKDNGEGIDPAFIDHAFDRFEQADASSARRHGGLGIGLAIVRQLVELHGGVVSATSGGPGLGSEFVVRFPLETGARADQKEENPDAKRREQHASLDAPLPRLDGLRVLVVDDEVDSREAVRRLLTARGAEVIDAGDAKRAFQLLCSTKPHVLVSDIGMPGEDGLSLIRRIRSLPPDAGGDVPALALTAYVRPTDRESAAAAGFDDLLGKPFSEAALVKTVARLRT